MVVVVGLNDAEVLLLYMILLLIHLRFLAGVTDFPSGGRVNSLPFRVIHQIRPDK
jgi:hypothetical protein